MLREYPGFDTHNICGNPIHRSTETAKSAVHDHDVSSAMIVPGRTSALADALDEIEQASRPGAI